MNQRWGKNTYLTATLTLARSHRPSAVVFMLLVFEMSMFMVLIVRSTSTMSLLRFSRQAADAMNGLPALASFRRSRSHSPGDASSSTSWLPTQS